MKSLLKALVVSGVGVLVGIVIEGRYGILEQAKKKAEDYKKKAANKCCKGSLEETPSFESNEQPTTGEK